MSSNISFVTNAANESTIYEVLEKDPGLTQLEPVTFEVGDTIYWSSQRKKVEKTIWIYRLDLLNPILLLFSRDW